MITSVTTTCPGGQAYEYDAAGNRTCAGGRTFGYVNGTGQLESCTGTSCAPVFDADGRLTRITTATGTWSYLYDGEGRMTSACRATSCTGSGFARLDSVYDGEGHRTRLVETPASGTPTTTDFTYEGDAVMREVATTGTTLVTRTFTVDEAGAIVKLEIATTPVAGSDDGTYLVVWNGHGDAVEISEIDPDTGLLAPANRFAYATWGTPTLSTVTGYGDLGFRYRYVGRFDVQWDSTPAVPAELLYMHARHYHPEFGRFLQPDPSDAEANLYAYAGNSPVSRIDPTGLIVWCGIPLIGWAVCAAGLRIAVWAGSSAVTFIGTALFKASLAAPAVASRGPLVMNMVRDNLGRVASVSTTITNATVRTGTAATHAARSWCCNGTAINEAGHLIAKVLGGPGGLRGGNIVAMLRALNNGPYRTLELRILRLAEAGNHAQVYLQLLYRGTSAVPYKIHYWYRINNGVWRVEIFNNY